MTLFDQVFNLVGQNSKKPKDVLIIAITGSWGSGKGTFCREFSEYLNEKDIKTVQWPTDMYYKWSRMEREKLHAKLKGKRGQNKLPIAYSPNSKLLQKHVLMMKARKSFKEDGLYQRYSGEMDHKAKIDFDKGSTYWIFLDGIFAVDADVRPYLDAVMFIAREADKRYQGMVYRVKDQKREYIISREYFDDVDEGYEDYLKLNSRDGDIIIDNNDFANRFIETNK